MRTKILWLAIGLGIASLACESEEAQRAGAATAANPASCEAMVDHRIGRCPEDATRLFDITLCEQDRVEMAPIGCSQPLADFVLCQTEAEIDCESGEALGCDDELSSLQRCRQQFAIRTSCSRTESRDAEDCGDTGRFSFACIDLATLQAPETPSHCEVIHERIFCCDSFSNDTLNESLFTDPVLGPDELPPDYSGVDFANAAMCLDFSEAQGWGRCETSSGCACTNCAAELSACAADYGCLVSHHCDRGVSCGGGPDPFFTGWGDSEPLVACMEAAGCMPTCN
jgi:hypothetical protein